MHQTALAYWHIDKFKNYSLCIYVSKLGVGTDRMILSAFGTSVRRVHRYRKCVAPYPERGSLDYGRDSKRKALIESAGLRWSVVESVPYTSISKDAKPGIFKPYIETTKQSIP